VAFALVLGLARRARTFVPALMLGVGLAPVLGPTDVRAEDDPDAEVERTTREVWSGAETHGHVWAFYSGVTAAADGLHAPGLRFRLSAGMSTYAYVDALGKARAAQPFADLLAGYQWQVGSLTVKGFAGATGYADFRPTEQVANVWDLWGQRRIGAKGVLEGWWTIDQRHWASLDLAYATPQASLWSRARVGHRLLPQFSLGAEAGSAGEVARPTARAGVFVRYDWADGEVALSGGIADKGRSGLAPDVGMRNATPYATLLWLQRF